VNTFLTVILDQCDSCSQFALAGSATSLHSVVSGKVFEPLPE